MRAIADPARLDRMFFALADVHRRGMLDRLSRGPASVTELAEPLGIALPSAVKHLAVLEQGGFVASQKLGRVRTYTAQPKALDEMEAWVTRRKTLLNAQFDRLDAYLAEQQGKATR
ncbi:MAG TPA: metalloregulator ArsR/SmtB family transcription factor [Burkholderiaceae bacterium]|uniref:ArsR/SmtB family transcription factor n=1 Tax=Piscinibacter sp. TaxID=1903157 RepID=UPI002BAF659D|nr:metalloregulator ArsR/SmtB family transcription factor [Burkholderiaceae bacterium]HNK17684.1 metalloregulator ArsR/SmtB family transcription factor [Piscinibacter sp.]